MIGRRNFLKSAATGLAGVTAAAKMPMQEVAKVAQPFAGVGALMGGAQNEAPQAQIFTPKLSFTKRLALMLADKALRAEIESEMYEYYRDAFTSIDPDIEVHKSWSPTFKHLQQRKRNIDRQFKRFLTTGDVPYPLSQAIDRIWDRSMNPSCLGFIPRVPHPGNRSGHYLGTDPWTG